MSEKKSDLTIFVHIASDLQFEYAFKWSKKLNSHC